MFPILMNMLIVLLNLVYYYFLFELYNKRAVVSQLERRRKGTQIPERERECVLEPSREEDLYTIRNYIQTRQISVYLCILMVL